MLTPMRRSLPSMAREPRPPRMSFSQRAGRSGVVNAGLDDGEFIAAKVAPRDLFRASHRAAAARLPAASGRPRDDPGLSLTSLKRSRSRYSTANAREPRCAVAKGLAQVIAEGHAVGKTRGVFGACEIRDPRFGRLALADIDQDLPFDFSSRFASSRTGVCSSFRTSARCRRSSAGAFPCRSAHLHCSRCSMAALRRASPPPV